jgi:CRP-like cAMP-binding protein
MAALMLPNPDNRGGANRLLARLTADELRHLRPELQPVNLEQGKIIYEPDRPMDFVYFIDQGMISVVSVMENGASIEVATIGNEGLTGWTAVLGAPRMRYRHNVQVPGRARRIRVATLVRANWPDNGLRGLVQRYQAAFLTQVMQGVACNGLHSIEQRLCRWLLSTRDRTGTPELQITHEFLAQMLGVRRASITDVLRPLQTRGLIRASRGKVVILDDQRLASSACECYHVIRGEYKWLLG